MKQDNKQQRPRRKASPAAELPTPPMEEFLTRDRANAGHKIPLYTADGRLTAHWVRVRGVDSDAFQLARTRQTRRIAEIAALGETDREAAIADSTLEMQASLVSEWSFDKPCTMANVKAFFRDAPQIASEVDQFASRRTFFFRMDTEDLMNTPLPSSP